MAAGKETWGSEGFPIKHSKALFDQTQLTVLLDLSAESENGNAVPAADSVILEVSPFTSDSFN